MTASKAVRGRASISKRNCKRYLKTWVVFKAWGKQDQPVPAERTGRNPIRKKRENQPKIYGRGAVLRPPFKCRVPKRPKNTFPPYSLKGFQLFSFRRKIDYLDKKSTKKKKIVRQLLTKLCIKCYNLHILNLGDKAWQKRD